MTSSEPRVEDLRRVLAGGCDTAASRDDIEAVQDAVEGRLCDSDLESLVDRLHRDPALAEAWRTAVLVRDELDGTNRSERVPTRVRWQLGVGLAAAVMLAAAVPVLMRWQHGKVAALRELPRAAIASRLADGAALPRDAFELEWRAGGDHGAFSVRVLDGDLRVVYEQRDVDEPRLLVPAASLTELEPGATVLWWVETTTAAGVRLRSPTFVQRLR